MRPATAATLLMLASGFAGLGYQLVWTQQASLWLGHEAAAVLAVVMAFFGGMALGAWALGGMIERSARPQRWYAACEALIAAWSLLLAVGLQPVAGAMLALIGPRPDPLWQGMATFGGTFLLLLPATAAMGAALPAVERLVAALEQAADGAQRIAHLYAANTLGALAGVLATAFWLVPSIGLVRSAMLCALLNLVCAAAALAWRTHGAAPTPSATKSGSGTLRVLALTGLLGIGYEVLVVRVASQVAEDTVYTFALLLAVYLLGTGAGASIYRRLAAAPASRRPSRDAWLVAQSLACLVGTASLWGAPVWRDTVAALAGHGLAGALAGEAAIALAAFLLPTMVMGGLFSHLAAQARAEGHDLGRVLAANTLGSAAAPLLIGVLLAAALGPKAALLIVSAGYLAAAGAPAQRRPTAWATVVLAAAALAFAPPLAFVDVPPGGRVLSYRDGSMAAVSVVEDDAGVARLRINNRQQEGSSTSRRADARQAWIPLLLHPAPQRALFLGLGTGVTARAAAEDPTLRVEAVELLPEVIEASALFAGVSPAPVSLATVPADARRFVRTAEARYDVIVADNFHPARSGSGSLYTVEHFEAVRSRLSVDGVFCQWLPLHQLDLDTLRSIVRSFQASFPAGGAVLATFSLETPVIGLVGRADGARFDAGALRRRMEAAAVRTSEFGLDDDVALFGTLIADARALQRFAGDAPLNTDDRPVVAYRAPRLVYTPDSAPRERLAALLPEMSVARGALVDDAGDAPWSERVERYRRARDGFILAGLTVRPSADPLAMLAQVRMPLLAALHESADFRPAYDPLLRLAQAAAGVDPALARSLLQELAHLQPQRTEAAHVLARLEAPPR